jgi:predicted dehydrogenase
MLRIGVVGYGNRISGVLNELMRIDDQCRITSVVDILEEEAIARMKQNGIDTSDIAFHENVDQMLAQGELDGIFIGTRCDLHTELALKIIPSGIPLFLEKPVSTNLTDLMKLRELNRTYPERNGNVVVSFPLRLSAILEMAKGIIDSGQIGTVEHVQAVNNVPYGGVYYQSWYRDASIHGGLFLAKTTHDFDYLNYVLGIKPVRVAAMASKQIFKGDKPARLTCANCDERYTCTESPENLRWAHEHRHGDYCVFAEDTGNEDSSSALVQYETGMHVSYSQNFFARKKAAARGARFLGYKGTVEFDFYTDEVKVFMHHIPKVEIHKLDSSQLVHFGGDTQLCRNFVDIMRANAKSRSPLDAGILSALMCIRAIESANSHTFQDITWPDNL